MKKTFTLSLCTFLFFSAIQAQELPYYFSVDNGTYTPLTDSISVNNGEVWDDPQFSLPLGFDFDFFDVTTDTLFIDSLFSGGSISTHDNGEGTSPILHFYVGDLMDRGYFDDNSISPISYVLEGEAGQQIFKAQWENAGFYIEDDPVSYVNIQLWIYEGSNDFQIHFGPSYIENHKDIFQESTGPFIGLGGPFNYDTEDIGDLWYLIGDTNAPTVSLFNIDSLFTITILLSGTPADGVIYKFSPIITSLPEMEAASKLVTVYPTLVKDQFTIEWKGAFWPEEKSSYQLFDSNGKMLKTENLSDKKTAIHIKSLSSGVYYVKVFLDQKNTEIKRIMKF